MIVDVGTVKYDCLRAVKRGDRATLYLVDPPGEMVELIGVSDWSKIVLDGGAWEEAAPDWREDMETMMVDQEYRITLLELGLEV